MSYAVDIPPRLNDFLDEDELEGYMDEIYAELTHGRQLRTHGAHDQASFFCSYAGSAECIALGHDQDNLDDDIHYPGWDGDMLCTATKFGTACSECEGECEYEAFLEPLQRDAFWALFAASEPTDSPKETAR